MARSDVKDFVGESRDDLGATLDEIEHRMRPDVMAKKFGSWVSRSYDEKAAPWLVGAAVALVGSVAAVLWALLGDD